MTLEEVNEYKNALIPLIDTYSQILSIENAKLIHLIGYRDEAIKESEKPKSFFQKLISSDEKAHQKAILLKEACDSLSFVIEMIQDRIHVVQITTDGKCDPLFFTDPDSNAVAAVMEHYINGRETLKNAPLMEVFELYEWNIRRLDEDISNNLVGTIDSKDLDAYNRWSAGQHQNDEVRNYLYENFSITSLY